MRQSCGRDDAVRRAAHHRGAMRGRKVGLDRRADELSEQVIALERKLRESSQRGEPVLRRREDRERAPLSFSQQRLWLIYQLDPKSHLYNVPRALRLRGTVRAERRLG